MHNKKIQIKEQHEEPTIDFSNVFCKNCYSCRMPLKVSFCDSDTSQPGQLRASSSMQLCNWRENNNVGGSEMKKNIFMLYSQSHSWFSVPTYLHRKMIKRNKDHENATHFYFFFCTGKNHIRHTYFNKYINLHFLTQWHYTKCCNIHIYIIIYI